jgi:hypothetical protein
MKRSTSRKAKLNTFVIRLFKKWAVVLGLLSGPALVLAQQSSQLDGGAEAAESATCSYTYSSGSGETFTRYCLSVNGNIVQFDSPQDFEFIKAGRYIGEGYGICDSAGPTAYFDYAAASSDNWQATVVTAPSATTRKFVRATSDGIWELTQTIKQIKATATGPGSVKVTMALKNLSVVSRDVFLLRYADIDANGTPDDDEFYFTRHSSIGSEPNHSPGLALTSNTFAYSAFTLTQSVSPGPNPCQPGAKRNGGPFVGDGSIGQIYNITVPAGATKTVNLTYKPI